MKEITRIINAQITMIGKVSDKDADTIIKSKNDAEKNVANDLKRIYKADDVQVEIKDFVMGKEV